MTVYPHLHGHLEGENVDSFQDLHKEEGEKGWGAALEKVWEWLQ